ncbi:MAG: hypothetical protein QOJ39_1856 [Candidatus Eremiobacteraeota bacterium]|nr:hypothetical protein [Candidatus Eremiobacteraeota bacterium]
MNGAKPWMLPGISYSAWEPSKTTIHLYSQIVGKIALRSSALRNHWWNCTLKPTARGVRTDRLHANGTSFDIELDFVDHRAIVRASEHDEVTFRLRDGLSVADFYSSLRDVLNAFGIGVPIVAKPYGVATLTTPFAEDHEHASYDADAVRRWWDVIRWSSDVMERFASEFAGKQSPVQLFWHSFDLATARYSGRRANVPAPGDPVAREAYSHEVIAFGFWAGDSNVPAPTYYTYTAPEPATLTTFALRPDGAAWGPAGSGHMGTVPYDRIRGADDPEQALLAFFPSAYEAGTRSAGWDTAALAHGDARAPGSGQK